MGQVACPREVPAAAALSSGLAPGRSRGTGNVRAARFASAQGRHRGRALHRRYSLAEWMVGL